jgi:hypothetical protein
MLTHDTQMQNIIKEWATGVFQPIGFTADKYSNVYKPHRTSLYKCEHACHDRASPLLDQILNRLYWSAQ